MREFVNGSELTQLTTVADVIKFPSILHLFMLQKEYF